MKYIYLGSFPPPYGGVTIKNNLIYRNLTNIVECKKINFSKIKLKNIAEILRFMQSLFNKNTAFIIGVSGNKTRKRLLRMLVILNKTAVNKSVIMVMGGVAHLNMVSDSKYNRLIQKYKRVYVETEGMKNHLNDGGISNVDVFPNCREEPTEFRTAYNNNKDTLRCLFFSRISEEKGVDIILEAASMLEAKEIQFSVDFYGAIDNDYRERFHNIINRSDKLSYRGIFKSDEENVYSKLSEYDLLLFPTKWKAEGVPGILVESKIASLPAIVSNQNYNAEIITDGVDGVVLNENNSRVLCNEIVNLYKNKKMLSVFKKNAKKSAQYYYIENHIDKILTVLEIKKGL